MLAHQNVLVFLLCCPWFPQIPSAINDLFNSEQCSSVTSQVFTVFIKCTQTFVLLALIFLFCGLFLFLYDHQTSSFWVMLQAVKEFVLNEGNSSLPVRGTIPDMIADSQKFIKLQNV